MKDNEIIIWSLIVLGGTLTACSSPPEPVALAGSEWVLVSIEGQPLAENTHINVAFDENAFRGFAGCNAYGSEYAIGRGDTLTISEIESSAQGCVEPEGVMQQEKAYIELLSNASTYRVVGEHLEIEGAAGETTLVFTRKEEMEMNPEELVGTQWRLVSLNGESLVEGSTITLHFDFGYVISGHAGCQDYVGTYLLEGEGIRVGSLGVKGAPCVEQEQLYRQQGRFTDMLTWVNAFRISEGRLEVFTLRGEELVFEVLER